MTTEPLSNEDKLNKLIMLELAARSDETNAERDARRRDITLDPRLTTKTRDILIELWKLVDDIKANEKRRVA
jgi:hypothetical protein